MAQNKLPKSLYTQNNSRCRKKTPTAFWIAFALAPQGNGPGMGQVTKPAHLQPEK